MLVKSNNGEKVRAVILEAALISSQIDLTCKTLVLGNVWWRTTLACDKLAHILIRSTMDVGK